MREHMDESKMYAKMCMILGDVVFGLRKSGYEISRENLIKFFANKRMHCTNDREAECYQSIINKLSDA